MKIAFLFPGQGSQGIGMGVALAERFPQARALFDQAKDVLGWDLLKTCQEGPEERLRETDVAQPALYVTGVAAALVLQENGVQPEAVAGHSIGEYAALAAAKVLHFEAGLCLVRERGRLMKEAGQKRPGGMVAVLGLSADQAEAVCQKARSVGVCVPVNFNSPEQIVIAGERPAIEKVTALATEAGAKRVIPLNVAGAFHSPLMKEAADSMRKALAGVAFKDASVPVVMNAEGAARRSSSEIREALARQLDSPVQWVKSLEALKASGFGIFVECGAGRVLSGLVKKLDRQLQTHSTETPEALLAAGEALGMVRRENA